MSEAPQPHCRWVPVALIKDSQTPNVSEFVCDGEFRVVTAGGRSGLNSLTLSARLVVPDHTLGRERGSLAFWVLPLEDLHASAPHGCHHKHLRDPRKTILVSDNADLYEADDCAFSIIWDSNWHPCFYAKFYRGSQYPGCYDPEDSAICIASHFDFPALRWHQIVATWDRPASRYNLYVNGVLVAAENRYVLNPGRDPLLRSDPVTDPLYLGRPQVAIGELAAFDSMLEAPAVSAFYEFQATDSDPDYQRFLRRRFTGAGNPSFAFSPDGTWQQRLNLSLCEEAHLREFYIQGNTDSARVTTEGLLVRTPWMNQPRVPEGEEDRVQMYLWTWREFEGDLFMEVEFNPLRDGGLCVLMVQAAGFHREDFLHQHPLRTNGSMSTVYCEDVRNYHWEFLREMNDVRNDMPSSALVKNPWFRPLGFGTLSQPIRKNGWNRLTYLQRGGHILGAINDEVVIDTQDSGTDNNGPILLRGRIALRCMVRTEVIFRNLRIWNLPQFESSPCHPAEHTL